MGGATVSIVTALYGGRFLLRAAAVGHRSRQDPPLLRDSLTDSCSGLQTLPTGSIALLRCIKPQDKPELSSLTHQTSVLHHFLWKQFIIAALMFFNQHSLT